MDNQGLIDELKLLIKQGREEILTTKKVVEGVIGARPTVNNELYAGWYSKCITILGIVLGEDDRNFQKFISYEKHYFSNAQEAVKILESVLDYCGKGIIVISEKKAIDPQQSLEIIFSSFRDVARQLRNRHNGRTTLEVNDEYDVQDLLHALLKLFFRDVRPEEWTPSYAGSASRMDFLLKDEKIVIEVKKTRDGLSDRQLGEQLIIDIEKYKTHPDCKKLVCFIYDPEARIGNPVGLIKDLKDTHKDFLDVYIKP